MDYIKHTDITGSDLEAVLFRSDILAPHEYWQVHRSNRFRQPELRLMLAVLEDALHSFFTNVQMRGRRQKRIFTETDQWFFNSADEGVFTFENICSLLGVDPDYVRRGLTGFKDLSRTAHKSSAAVAA